MYRLFFYLIWDVFVFFGIPIILGGLIGWGIAYYFNVWGWLTIPTCMVLGFFLAIWISESGIFGQ